MCGPRSDDIRQGRRLTHRGEANPRSLTSARATPTEPHQNTMCPEDRCRYRSLTPMPRSARVDDMRHTAAYRPPCGRHHSAHYGRPTSPTIGKRDSVHREERSNRPVGRVTRPAVATCSLARPVAHARREPPGVSGVYGLARAVHYLISRNIRGTNRRHFGPCLMFESPTPTTSPPTSSPTPTPRST
jgi:hypothetical protein